MSVDTANQDGVVIPTTAGAQGTPLGVALTTMLPGAEGPIRVLGTGVAIAGAAIGSGIFVTTSNTAGQLGRAVTAGAAAPSVGFTLNAAAAAGDEVEIFLCQGRNAL